MTEDEIRRLAKQYGDMSEIELMDIARAYDGLEEAAKPLLRGEFARRSLEPPLIEEPIPQPVYRDLVTVERYRDLSEAIVARSVLEAAGVECFLKDENTIRMDWAWSNLLGGLRLQVAGQDVDIAKRLLSQPRPQRIEFAEEPEEEPEFEQPICPKCGSTEVVLDSGGRKVAMTSWLVLGVPIPAPSKHTEVEEWRCTNCGCIWMDDGEPDNPASLDPLR